MIRFAKPLGAVFILAILLGSHDTQAAPTCFDKTKAAAITRDFSFEGDSDYDSRKCNPGSLTEKILPAIQFLKGIKNTQSPQGPFALNLIEGHPYKYLMARVHTIVFMNGNEGHCKGLMTAYVNRKSSGRMYICSSEYFAQPLLKQASILIHEARHFDGFGHVSCVRGSFADQPEAKACDSNYTDGGSYAIENSLHLQISQDETSSPALRRAAKMQASTSLVARFNTLPADLKDGAFVTNKNKLVSFFDGKTSKAALQLKQEQSLMYFPDGNPRLQTKGISHYTDFTFGLAQGSIKESKTYTGNLMGLAANRECFFVLYPSSLKVFSRSDTTKIIEIKFSQIRPIAIFGRKTPTLSQIFIADRDGRYIILPERFEQFKELRESQLKMGKNEMGIVKSQIWQGYEKEIALINDGRVMMLNYATDKWSQALSGNDFIDVIAPVVWSKSLQNL